MTVLGIDPGIERLGFGLVQSQKGELKPLSYGLIHTESYLSRPQRLSQIFEDVNTLIHKWNPDYVALESLIFSKNVKTAMTVSEVRGVLLLLAQQNGKDVQEFTPLQVKTAVCGYGRASKEQIQSAVKLILSLPEIPRPDDVADALAIAICSINHREFQQRTHIDKE